ncbi:ubiquinone biosynthesis O-methyltransferase, mitochondrial-like [Uranotaenia lowii]|uniref:ubiquinone biosynthesis O-methyltransferase, mitochondrial-like n=1 Tax=Uranotaenia lowii TaxID=190385 RepID=UPI00247867A5|nr:ubiquinone biosynthesis O-methyltransferase, mitochondrial-like [Uranotaenia lowii]
MLSPYYLIYLILGPVFKIAEKLMIFLKVNILVNALEQHFGYFVIGLNDPRPKETAPKDSVSQTEISHMAKMVEFWWNPKGPAKMMHTFHQVRVPLVIEGLAEVGKIPSKNITSNSALDGIRILEAGCGGGVLAEDLAYKGAYVVGIDPCKEMIDLAKTHLETKSKDLKKSIEYHTTTVEEHAKQFANSYDAVVCSEVMEHVDEKESVLEACVRCLKPGGSLYITTENQTMLSWFTFILIPEYILKFIPKGTHFYEKFISPESVSCMLAKHGCKTKRVRGFFYDRFRNKWSFISNADCNYGLHAVKQ